MHQERHDDEDWNKLIQFTRGGFWRNFRVKYPESNEMYARSLEISTRIAQLDAEQIAELGKTLPDINEPAAAQPDNKLINLLLWAVEASEDEEGWAELGAVGAKIMAQQPDFDSRSYGFAKLSRVVEATEAFEIERVTSKNGRVDILLRELPKKQPRRSRSRR